jgi:DNA-binding NarL/FixJ family response regulator
MPKPKQPVKPARKQTRIFLVDDHPIYRKGLTAVIEQDPVLTICGQADNAVKAFEEIRRLKPDLVLSDIGLPGRSGLELLKDLVAFEPGLPVIIISMHDEALYAERVLHAGGRGYVMKQEGPEKILEAITRVLGGKVYLSDKASSGILERLGPGGSDRRKAGPIGNLTDREFEVLRLIGEGKDSHEIARDLHLSLKTVHCHRAHIREKLGLKSGAAIVHFASRWINEQ